MKPAFGIRWAAPLALALTLAACGTAQGPFVPTASLDPTQVEQPAPQIVVPVTPQECIVALDGAQAFLDAQRAIIDAQVALLQGIADQNIPAQKRALTALEAAITAFNALDPNPVTLAADDCHASAQ